MQKAKQLLLTLFIIVFMHSFLYAADRDEWPLPALWRINQLPYKNLTIRTILENAQHGGSVYDLLVAHTDPFFRNPANGTSLLDQASFEGNLAVVKSLIASMHQLECPEYIRGYINSPGLFGKRPLHYAAQSGNSLIIQLLLELGANSCVVNDEGWTALHYAQSEEVIEILVNAGVNPSAHTYYGETALHFFAQSPTKAFTFIATLIHILRKKYPDKSFKGLINHQDHFSSKTVLHLVAESCENNMVECLQVLLNAGANPFIQARDHSLPVHAIIQRRTTCESAAEKEQLNQAVALLWTHMPEDEAAALALKIQ